MGKSGGGKSGGQGGFAIGEGIGGALGVPMVGGILGAKKGSDMMGGKSGGGGIPNPDFMALAQKQSVESHPNISTPNGNFTWTQDPNTGQWSGSASLDADTQRALDAQQGMQAQRSQAAQGMMGSAMGQLAQGVDYAGLGKIQDGSAARDQAINAAYGQATSRLDPQFAQRETSLRNQLYGQGLREGDQAFDNAMSNFSRDRNDAYGSAMNSAIGQGTAAGQAVFGQNLQARQQNISEQQANQYQGLNAVNSLLAGQQVTQPAYPGLGTQGADYMGAGQQQYQAGLDAYNAQMQMYNGILPGAGPFLFGGGLGNMFGGGK